jgi:TetR/AcrR family transcriptional repressor for divergent bdcA
MPIAKICSDCYYLLLTMEINVAETARTRRPRRPFDRQLGLERAQRLFHERGYDGVSLADLTEALDINPPSLYAAYGSKAGLFRSVLDRYMMDQALPLSEFFDGRDLGDAVALLFVSAADQYSRDGDCRGCLVTEGARAADADARNISQEFSAIMNGAIREELIKRAPDDADILTDLVVTIIRGLSASAYTGMERSRLMATAERAGALFRQINCSAVR